MKLWSIVLALVLALSAGGLEQKETVPRPRVVTAVEADYDGRLLHLRRSYTDEEKMRQVLTCLRAIKPLGTVAPEAELPEEGGTVTLLRSDGTAATWELRGGAYLRRDGGSWQTVDPEQAQQLPLLLAMLESD